MKRFVFVVLAIVFTIYMFGCGKKQASLEEMQEPISMESLSALSTETQPKAQPQVQTVEPIVQAPLTESTEKLPPSGPYKPTTIEIQTALNNAGFYAGLIDGKIGPLAKKAIEDFQKANNLKVDGKVGPQTWAVLGVYLNPAPATKTKAKKR